MLGHHFLVGADDAVALRQATLDVLGSGVFPAQDFDNDIAVRGKRFFRIVRKQALGQGQQSRAFEVADEDSAEDQGHPGALRASGSLFR